MADGGMPALAGVVENVDAQALVSERPVLVVVIATRDTVAVLVFERGAANDDVTLRRELAHSELPWPCLDEGCETCQARFNRPWVRS